MPTSGPRTPLRRSRFVISPVVMSGYRSGPRWLMALADCNAAEMLGASMLGSDKTGAVRAFVSAHSAHSARSRDAHVYRRYAALLYRQALLTRGDPASAEHAVCDVLVNEAALARIPERSEDDARYRLTESVLRRCQQLAAEAVATHPRDIAALFHAVMRMLASSSAAVAEDGSQRYARPAHASGGHFARRGAKARSPRQRGVLGHPRQLGTSGRRVVTATAAP
jgi:hypothetical protein